MKRSMPAALAAIFILVATTTRAGEIRDRYDVVVAGAGTGGCGAALEAARLGAAVLLVEETDWIGGQMNAAAVTSMDEGLTLVRERGLYHELVQRIEAHYAALGKSAETAYWGRHICCEPRVGRAILHQMLASAHGAGQLDLALRTRVVRVVKHRDTVAGAELETVTPQGKQSRGVQCGVLIDATEWGDVIPLTGARYRVGNCTSDAIDPGRKIQMLTWTAVIKRYPQGVPQGLLLRAPPPGYTPKVHQTFVKTLADGAEIDFRARPCSWATFLGYRAMPDSSQPGDWPLVTRTHMNFNNDFEATVADVEDPGRREATCRAARLKTLHLLYYIQYTLGKTDWSVADDEGFDSPYNRAEIDRWLQERPELRPFGTILYHFSVMAYARESRRIIGLDTLTARAIRRKPGPPRHFPSTIALADYPIDLHGSATPQYLELDLDGAEDISHEFGDHGIGPFGVPWECFIPERIDGFLAAEKNISQSRLANGATRLQPSTLLTGQAAGAIAALAVRHAVPPRRLDPVLVQCVLLDSHDTLLETSLVDVARHGWEWKPIQLAAVHELLLAAGGRFRPGDPLTQGQLETAMSRLLDPTRPAVGGGTAPVGRAAFAAALRKASAGSLVTLSPGSGPGDADEPLSRAEAAAILAQFLELRAIARTTGAPQSLAWPPSRKPTLLTPEDVDPLLAAAPRQLAQRGIIDDVDYWLRHALPGESCDGAKTAALVLRAARAFVPGTSNHAQAVDVLARQQIVGRPDYWLTSAVPGGHCAGLSVQTLIHNLARSRLR
jgi:hypothetical protein